MELLTWYLENSGGSTVRFWQNVEDGQRIGQAFFNALSEEEKHKLRGTAQDPFYLHYSRDVETVIDQLTGRD